MIRDCLNHSKLSNHGYKFNIIDVSESELRKEKLFPSWLSGELHIAYKNLEHLKRRYLKREKDELRKYLKNEVFPELR